MRIRPVLTLVTAVAIIIGSQFIDVGRATAGGAIAVGKCDRIGWSYGSNLDTARYRALWECSRNGDSTCRIVTTTVDACAAIAVSGDCGSRGWATAGSRARAEQMALNECWKFGGRDCSVRRWVCS
jgi:hypothetical protein